MILERKKKIAPIRMLWNKVEMKNILAIKLQKSATR
jgi:hypothetical protein